LKFAEILDTGDSSASVTPVVGTERTVFMIPSIGRVPRKVLVRETVEPSTLSAFRKSTALGGLDVSWFKGTIADGATLILKAPLEGGRQHNRAEHPWKSRRRRSI
jgi:hypothetical protein